MGERERHPGDNDAADALRRAAESFDFPDLRWRPDEYATLGKMQQALRARADTEARAWAERQPAFALTPEQAALIEYGREFSYSKIQALAELAQALAVQLAEQTNVANNAKSILLAGVGNIRGWQSLAESAEAQLGPVAWADYQPRTPEHEYVVVGDCDGTVLGYRRRTPGRAAVPPGPWELATSEQYAEARIYDPETGEVLA